MFLFDWDRSYYTFSRSLKDVTPYEFIRDENKTIIVHNVVGLSKNDLNISLEKENKIDYLKISGEKKNTITNKTYSVSSRFSVDADEIDNVEWYVEDGILYITVWFKKPEKPSIDIKYKEKGITLNPSSKCCVKIDENGSIELEGGNIKFNSDKYDKSK